MENEGIGLKMGQRRKGVGRENVQQVREEKSSRRWGADQNKKDNARQGREKQRGRNRSDEK